MNLLRREPVMVGSLIQAGVALATAFGLHLTPEQVGAIVTATSLLFGLIARSQVSPVVK